MALASGASLHEAVRLLANLEGVAHVVFTSADVIRHDLVARIVDAYDAAGQAAARKREARE